MSKMRNKTPQQPAKERVKNFFEVALGFSQEQAGGGKTMPAV